MPKRKSPIAAQPGESAAVKRTRSGVKGIRIEEVARAAGVSPITVSRVFNSPKTVAPETLARVRDVVAALGYVPNRLAGGLSSARSRLVAAVVPTIWHSLFSETIQVFSEVLSASGYQVLLALGGYDDANEGALLETVLSRRPEGILLIGVARQTSLRERLRAVGIPIVETWDLTDSPIDMLVGFSHFRIGEAVAELFLQRGIQQPGLVSADDDRAMARRAGFRDRLAKAGVIGGAEVIVDPPSSVAAGKAALATLLEARPGLDAVFCGSDRLAVGVLSEARRLGIEVPSALAVCGFGDLEFAAETLPALTTVRVDGYRIGHTAAQCLLSRFEDRAPARCVDVGFDIVVRNSC